MGIAEDFRPAHRRKRETELEEVDGRPSDDRSKDRHGVTERERRLQFIRVEERGRLGRGDSADRGGASGDEEGTRKGRGRPKEGGGLAEGNRALDDAFRRGPHAVPQLSCAPLGALQQPNGLGEPARDLVDFARDRVRAARSQVDPLQRALDVFGHRRVRPPRRARFGPRRPGPGGDSLHAVAGAIQNRARADEILRSGVGSPHPSADGDTAHAATARRASAASAQATR